MPLDGFCEAKSKASRLRSGVLRVSPNVLISHCFLGWLTQLKEAEYSHRKFQDGVDFTGTGLRSKHSVVQLLLTHWSVVLTLVQPGAAVTPQGIHSKLPIVAFTKPKVEEAGAQFQRWLFHSQGTGGNKDSQCSYQFLFLPNTHLPSPVLSLSDTASHSSHSELT